MKNRLKNLLILLLFVAASFVGVKGAAAATGTATAQMQMGTANISLIGNTNFNVNTAAPINASGQPRSQDTYSAMWNDVAANATPELYVVACWGFTIQQVAPFSYWNCKDSDLGPAPGLITAVQTTISTNSLGTQGPLLCGWMIGYDPATGTCGTGSPGSTTQPGQSSMMPSLATLDQFVGQNLTFNVVTNWCTYIGVPGAQFPQVLQSPGAASVEAVGCNSSEVGITAAAKMGVASSSPSCASDGVVQCVPVTVFVEASATDCHVPLVKGLTLRKAKTSLHKANCRASVRYVKGKVSGRVRYQPIKVGTGKPRNYPVKLAVVR